MHICLLVATTELCCCSVVVVLYNNLLLLDNVLSLLHMLSHMPASSITWPLCCRDTVPNSVFICYHSDSSWMRADRREHIIWKWSWMAFKALTNFVCFFFRSSRLPVRCSRELSTFWSSFFRCRTGEHWVDNWNRKSNIQRNNVLLLTDPHGWIKCYWCVTGKAQKLKLELH